MLVGLRRPRLVVVAAALVAASWVGEVPAQQPSGPASTLAGPVTRIPDGDSIEVAGQPIRLKGITCEERGTPLGERAVAELRAIARRQTVYCVLSGERSYARALAWCALANGLDLGEYLVRRGVCGRCPRYDPEGRYLAADREAGPYAGHVPRYCRRF